MKVALIGTSNCGKTTLITKLDQDRVFENHSVICEVAGKFSKSSRAKLSTQVKILNAQIAEEGKYTNFISDRSVIDNTAYFLYYYKDSKAPNKRKIFSEYMSTFNDHMLKRPYDAVIVIDQAFPLEDNGIRDMNKEMQDWVLENIEHIALVWGDVYDVPVYSIRGSLEHRVKKVKSVLQKYYSQKRVSDYA